MRSRAIKLTALMMTACMMFSSIGSIAATKKQDTKSLAAQIHESLEKTGRKASVKLTNIPATGVSASERAYANVFYKQEYKLDKPTDEETTNFRSQAAMIDKEGEIVFPFTYGSDKGYNCYGNTISFANALFADGIITDRTYDGVPYVSRYYDLDLNEVFSIGGSESCVAMGDTVNSQTQIYDTKANLLYEIPADLQKAAIWKEEDYNPGYITGLPDCEMKYKFSFVSLGITGEGLTSFGSAIPMNEKLELPDLKGTKWDSENGIDYVSYFRENAIKDGKTSGFVDASGKIVIPQSFGACGPFSDGLAWVVSPESMKMAPDLNETCMFGMYYIDKNVKVGFIDKTGKLVIPYEYDAAGGFYKGFAAVEKDGKSGIIDKNNNVVIPFEYENAFGGNGELFSVAKDGKFGIVDKDNKEVIPFLFDDISVIEDGVVYGVYDGKIVIINMNEDSSSDWDRSSDKKGYLNQVVKINTSDKTVKASKLKKKAQKFKLDGSAMTAVTYKKKSGNKGIKVSASGVVTLKKGLKKKTYKLTVTATAKDDGTHKSVSVNKTIKIKVK